jgi:hypothetical protein
LREYQARYARSNPETQRAKKRALYAKNPERGREYCRRFYAANAERLGEKKRTYNHANLERWRQVTAARWATDLEFRIQRALRARITSAIKRSTKTGSAIRDLGCSIDELKTYIAGQFRGGMTWDNWPSVWHLDHIRPLCSFDLTDRDQFVAAAHYTNLQPLLVAEHRIKSQNDRKLARIP